MCPHRKRYVPCTRTSKCKRWQKPSAQTPPPWEGFGSTAGTAALEWEAVESAIVEGPEEWKEESRSNPHEFTALSPVPKKWESRNAQKRREELFDRFVIRFRSSPSNASRCSHTRS